MDIPNTSRKQPAPKQLFSNADLQRCELAALGEWFVVISTRGRTQLVETFPQGYRTRKSEVLPRRRIRR